MPYDKVLSKFEEGKLHSGSKSGPSVKSRTQAIAIMLSEKRAAEGGKKEYQSMKKQSGGKFARSAMGRKVIHHSPDQHPQQDDPYAALDKLTEAAAQNPNAGTLRGARKVMQPAQQESSTPQKELMGYLKRLRGGK